MHKAFLQGFDDECERMIGEAIGSPPEDALGDLRQLAEWVSAIHGDTCTYHDKSNIGAIVSKWTS